MLTTWWVRWLCDLPANLVSWQNSFLKRKYLPLISCAISTLEGGRYARKRWEGLEKWALFVCKSFMNWIRRQNSEQLHQFLVLFNPQPCKLHSGRGWHGYFWASVAFKTSLWTFRCAWPWPYAESESTGTLDSSSGQSGPSSASVTCGQPGQCQLLGTLWGFWINNSWTAWGGQSRSETGRDGLS